MEALRTKVYLRDKGCCKKCGKWCFPDNWHLSHTKGKRMWGDSPETTEVNCADCHDTFHRYGKSMQKPVPKK